MLKVDFTHDPMANRLTGAVRCQGVGTHLHAANTAPRAPDPHELGALALLQQG